MAEVIITSGEYEKTPAGAYQATFSAITVAETKNGPCYRWEFKTLDGLRTLSGLAGTPGKGATIKSRYGKWLCAVAGRPLSEGTVDPELHIGKQFMVIVDDSGNIAAITKMQG